MGLGSGHCSDCFTDLLFLGSDSGVVAVFFNTRKRNAIHLTIFVTQSVCVNFSHSFLKLDV